MNSVIDAGRKIVVVSGEDLAHKIIKSLSTWPRAAMIRSLKNGKNGNSLNPTTELKARVEEMAASLTNSGIVQHMPVNRFRYHSYASAPHMSDFVRILPKGVVWTTRGYETVRRCAGFALDTMEEIGDFKQLGLDNSYLDVPRFIAIVNAIFYAGRRTISDVRELLGSGRKQDYFVVSKTIRRLERANYLKINHKRVQGYINNVSFTPTKLGDRIFGRFLDGFVHPVQRFAGAYAEQYNHSDITDYLQSGRLISRKARVLFQTGDPNFRSRVRRFFYQHGSRKPKPLEHTVYEIDVSFVPDGRVKDTSAWDIAIVDYKKEISVPSCRLAEDKPIIGIAHNPFFADELSRKGIADYVIDGTYLRANDLTLERAFLSHFYRTIAYMLLGNSKEYRGNQWGFFHDGR